MAKLVNRVRSALNRDSETVPLDSFSSINSRVQVHGCPRIDALAEVLEANPQTRGPTQLYLTALVRQGQKQVGGWQAMFTAFSNRVMRIPETTLEALPAHTRTALTRLGEVAEKTPIPCPDAMLVAHGLTIDGEFCRLVAELSGEPEQPKETGPAVARRLLAKHHPDKGGDAETFAAVSEMYKALK